MGSGGSFKGVCMRDTVDTLQMWEDMRNVDIMQNRDDIDNNADISKLYAIRSQKICYIMLKNKEMKEYGRKISTQSL